MCEGSISGYLRRQNEEFHILGASPASASRGKSRRMTPFWAIDAFYRMKGIETPVAPNLGLNI